MASFNLIAPFYDRLKHLVFGDTLNYYQSIFISKLPKSASHLVVGGGSGELALDIIENAQPTRILLLDHSEKMIDLSKKRLKESADYLVGDIRTAEVGERFDFIHLPFVLDCLPEEDVAPVIDRLQSFLNKEGHIVLSDFSPKNRSQRLFLAVMYLFFLPYWNRGSLRLAPLLLAFARKGMMPIAKKENESGFIFSAILSSTSTPRGRETHTEG